MEDLESLIWLSIVPSISTACLHVLILRALEELVNLGEELVLSDLILGALKDLINGSKVGLNLVLDVLVHAQLLLGILATSHEALDLSHVDSSKVSLDNLLLVKLLRKGGGNLMANIKDLLISVLEPGTGHVKLLNILLHGANINFVLSIQAVNLSEDTGHVSNLGLLFLEDMLNLLLESVVKSKSIGISCPLEAEVSHEVGHLLKVWHVEVHGGSHGSNWGLILFLLSLHLGDHLEHLFKLVHVHLVVVHAIFVVVLALHHVIRHHLLTHERIIILHVGHHLLEGHHHLELVHLVIHVVIVVLVVGVVLIIIVIVLHVWSGLISSVVLVLAVIMFLIDDAHHLVQLLKLVGLHITGKGEHHVDGVDLHVVFPPAALHGLGLRPGLEHVLVVTPMGKSIRSQQENCKNLHLT